MKKTDPIQQTIEAALKEAELHDPSSEDYTTFARNVETLAKAKALGESKKLSKDAILGAVTSMAGIVAVLQYERLAVVSSKAFGLIMKVKPF